MNEAQLTEEQLARVREEIEAENKIEAIKLCREYTGWGLKEAKDFVERHIEDLIERDPEKYGYLLSRGSSGCFGIFLIFSCSIAGIVSLVIV